MYAVVVSCILRAGRNISATKAYSARLVAGREISSVCTTSSGTCIQVCCFNLQLLGLMIGVELRSVLALLPSGMHDRVISVTIARLQCIASAWTFVIALVFRHNAYYCDHRHHAYPYVLIAAIRIYHIFHATTYYACRMGFCKSLRGFRRFWQGGWAGNYQTCAGRCDV